MEEGKRKGRSPFRGFEGSVGFVGMYVPKKGLLFVPGSYTPTNLLTYKTCETAPVSSGIFCAGPERLQNLRNRCSAGSHLLITP